MQRILATYTSLFMILIIFLSSVSILNASNSVVNNEPDVAKKQLLIESAKITDIGMQAAKETMAKAFYENITEADVVRAAESAMIGSGSSENIEAFGVIVASGEQSALEHGDSSDDENNLILPGEVVVVDLGARYRGYCTDLTRTFFIGQPTEEMMEIYNITMEAQEAAFKVVRMGVLARDVDRVARDIIKNYGYGDNFTHGLGHGIGVYIHMPPILSPSSNGVLIQSSDMAITIEPGIYLRGRFGVRIEDDVLVTRTGFQLITHSPKGLSEAIIFPDNYMNATEEVKGGSSDSNAGENDLFVYGLIGFFIAVAVVFLIFKKYRTH